MTQLISEYLAQTTTRWLALRRRARAAVAAWFDAASRRGLRAAGRRDLAIVAGVLGFTVLVAVDAAGSGGTGPWWHGGPAVPGQHLDVVAATTPAGSGRAALGRAESPLPATAEVAAPAPAAAPAAATASAPGSAPLPRPGAVPVGKGMWIWLPEATEGGDVAAIVGRAHAAGLTHLYVQTGSSWKGFIGAGFLDALLPAAHEAGLRVYGWDFPNFADIDADVVRAVAAITHTTPGGHRLDGFSADIETRAEGTNITAEGAATYGTALRNHVGDGYPLIATVPRPSATRVADYPYAEVVASFDAIAPMVYWLNRQPDTDAAEALAWLAQFGKPLVPVGQAYDGAPEGGRPGPPPPDEIERFIRTAEAYGAVGVSFWSWQAASAEIWDTITRAPQFSLPVGDLLAMPTEHVRTVQAALASLGYPSQVTGVWDVASWLALMRLQTDRGAPPTGVLDAVTRSLLVGPVPRR